jgi:hypothetical protein
MGAAAAQGKETVVGMTQHSTAEDLSLGNHQARIDHILNKILKSGADREAELWPTIYAYREAIEKDAHADADEAWTDWLVAMYYPFDWAYDPPPPISRQELAEAWHRSDPSVTAEDWLMAIGWELGPLMTRQR